MPDTTLPLPFQTRRLPAGIAPIDGGLRGGRETQRVRSGNGAPGPAPELPATAAPATAANREAAVLAEQRRLRRQLEASLRDQLLTGTSSTEDTIVCQLCELLWADHACLWMLPTQPDEAQDWSRQTIVSEAVAEYYPLVGYSTCTPTEEWSRACLEPSLQADGAVLYSAAPFNTPKEGDPDPSAFARYLTHHLSRSSRPFLAAAARTLRRVGGPGDPMDGFRP